MEFVPDKYKTQEMCDKAIAEGPWSLIYVPDWFVMLHEMCYEDYSRDVTPEPWHYDDKIIEWRNGYKNARTKKHK